MEGLDSLGAALEKDGLAERVANLETTLGTCTDSP